MIGMHFTTICTLTSFLSYFKGTGYEILSDQTLKGNVRLIENKHKIL